MTRSSAARFAAILALLVTILAPATAGAVSGGTQENLGHAFLQGRYVEVGVRPNGAFGSSPSAVPAGYHANPSSLGFRVDRDEDGWGVGTDDGDFFTPGSPYEAWILRVGATELQNSDHGTAIPGSIQSVETVADRHVARWAADAPAAGLTISHEYTVPDTGKLLVAETTITNASASDVTDIYFARGLDPDNQTAPDVYTSTNTVVSQPGGGDDVALVSAEWTNGAWFGLRAIDARARVSHGGFYTNGIDAIWNGTSPTYDTTVGSSRTADAGMNVVVNVGTLAAGESTTVTVAYVLSADAAETSLTGVGFDPVASSTSEADGAVVATVTLDEVAATDVSVDWATAPGTAGADDFTASSGTLVIAAGDTSGTISVPIADDDLVEVDEQFTIALSSPSGAQLRLGSVTHTATIVSDDVPAVAFGPSVTIAEGETATVDLTLDQAPLAPVTVQVLTSGGSATAAADYEALDETVTFEVGETSASVDLTTLEDDAVETDEDVVLSFGTVAGAVAGTPATATVTLTSTDEPVASPAADAVTVGEEAGSVTIVVELDQPAAATGSLLWTTVEGSASADRDYRTVSGTLTFSAGDREATIEVPILNDAIVEDDETFLVQLSDPTGLGLDGDEVVVTIVSNDVEERGVTVDGSRETTDDGAVIVDPTDNAEARVPLTAGGFAPGSTVTLRLVDADGRTVGVLTAIADALGVVEFEVDLSDRSDERLEIEISGETPDGAPRVLGLEIAIAGLPATGVDGHGLALTAALLLALGPWVLRRSREG